MLKNVCICAFLLTGLVEIGHSDERSPVVPVRYERKEGKRFVCAQPSSLAQKAGDATLFVAGTNARINSNQTVFGDVESFDLEDGSVVYLTKFSSAWLCDRDKVDLVVKTKLRAKFWHFDLARRRLVLTAGVDEHSRDFAVRIVLEDQKLMGELNKQLAKIDNTELGKIIADGQIVPIYDEAVGCLKFTDANGELFELPLPQGNAKNPSRNASVWVPLQRPLQVDATYEVDGTRGNQSDDTKSSGWMPATLDDRASLVNAGQAR
ncbi:hypothetical protein C2E31_07265 [Rhodopirellula baltica]|nr:hypothetical protein C2E31_07265 [Rhodopirellula baltica]